MDCDNGARDAYFDFFNSANIYIACAAPPGVRKSTDGGATFSPSQGGIDSSELVAGRWPALAMDPSDPKTLYFAGQHIWQTTDGANSWTAISADIGNLAQPESLAVAQSDPNTVYLGSSAAAYVTTNGKAGSGAAWTNISAGLPLNQVECSYSGPTCNYLTRIAADPSNASMAYVTFAGYVSGHIYKTTNRGGTWTDISGDLPNIKVNDIAVDPDVPDTLYIATERGVWATADGGGTWSPLGTGLPNVVVAALKLHRPTRILRAATFGRSAWDLQLPTVPSPVTLSASSLEFGSQAGSQTVTMTNAGTAPVTLYGLTVPGGFTQSNTCKIQIQSGANCNITVTFAPSAVGSYSGNVTITDDAPGSPQLITVTGTAATIQKDFSVVASSSFATVTPGQTAGYSLNVIPLGGFDQTVSLACSGAPSGAKCSLLPGLVKLNGNDAVIVTVAVTTAAPSKMGALPIGPSALGSFRLPPMLAAWVIVLIVVLSIPSLFGVRRQAVALSRGGLGLVIFIALVWISCGGGAASGGGNPGTPPGAYTLTVSGTYASSSTTLSHDVTLTLTVN